MDSLSFHNGIFKIMQITDVQEIADFSPDTEALLLTALSKEKPDLAVLTGDQIKGYGVTMHAGNPRANAEKVIGKIISCMEKTQTPFTVLFGNHDVFCGIDKKQQWEMYRRSPLFIDQTETELDGYGIFDLPVLGKDGKPAFVIYGLDSGGYDKQSGGYRGVTEDQIAFYRKKRDEWEKKEGRLLPALVFQHIPVPEVYELMEEVPKTVKGALRGAAEFADKYFVLGNKTEPGGFMHENAAIPAKNSGEFDALCEKGDVVGLFFGHDHINSFCGTLRGVRMGYTQSCGFNVYGPGVQRGVRVFTFHEENIHGYETMTLTYRDLIGNELKRPAKNFLYTYAPSSVGAALDQAKKAGKAALLTGAAIGAVVLWNKKSKH